jgi:hypothetical protein
MKIGLWWEGTDIMVKLVGYGPGLWVVGCAFASLLGIEYEQYYIQKRLDIT